MAIASRLSRALAWGLVAWSALILTGLIGLEVAGCRVLLDPTKPQPAAAYGLIMLPLNNMGFAILGALILTYQPSNKIGWISLIVGAGLITSLSGFFYGACSLLGYLELPFALEAVWLDSLGNVFFVLFGIFPWLFPDGEFLSPTWRRAGMVFLGSALFFSLLTAFWPGPFTDNVITELVIENPFALPFDPDPLLDSVFRGVENLSTSGLFLLGIFSLIRRWRQAEGRVRQQIKWLTYFLMTSGVFFLSVEIFGEALYPAIFDGWFYLVELLVFWLGFPVVLGLAIFRYRLYDIDLVIRRTLSYAVLTAVLGLVYFGGVVLMQAIFRGLSGQPDSPLITVLSTLAIAALFNPLRTRIQDFIDRRFYRRKYDAEVTLDRFASAAREQVDLDSLSVAMLGAVEETLQPEQVSLWLKGQDFG